MKQENAVKAFIALGHESRLAIFRYLTQQGEEGVPAGEISRHFDMPGATLSFHLSQLSAAKLVDARRDGRTIYYSVKFKRIKKIMKYLSENYYQNKPSVEIIEEGEEDTPNEPTQQ